MHSKGKIKKKLLVWNYSKSSAIMVVLLEVDNSSLAEISFFL